MENSKHHFKISEKAFIVSMIAAILIAVAIIAYMEWKGRTGV